MSKKTIQVTEPHLPPIDDYIEYLRGIWQRNLLSNHGPLVCELEQKIQSYHDIDMAVRCDTNGGLDLRYAIDASKIARDLGWEPKQDPESGFRKTVHWYLDNKEWWSAILDGSYKLERLGRA